MSGNDNRGKKSNAGKTASDEQTDVKNGIIDGIYYENDAPVHKGVIKIGKDIYYAGRGGKIAAGEHHDVHSVMSNGILKRGTYEFAPDGKLIPGSYIKPKKKKKRSKLKGQTKMVIAALAAFALFLCVVLIIPRLGDRSIKVDESESVKDNESEVQTAEIVLPSFDEPVYLCSDKAADYYKGILSLDEAVIANNNAGAYKGFDFEYEIKRGVDTEGQDAELRAILEISDDESFGDAVQYTLDPDKTVLTIDNLFPGTTYYYRVTAREVSLGDDSESGESNTYYGQFTTADTDRFVNIPDLENTRDIGGYVTADGRTTKYGMIIRGTELDGLVESKYFLADREAAEPFGFVCDLDLREESLFNGNYQSMLGKNVIHKFYSAPMYGSIFGEGYQPALREIFHDLANPDNYPMYLHCTYGADRTGTIIFLLQGALGISEEDMARQYELTAFLMDGYDSDRLNPIFGGLEGTEGDTVNEKIVNYLVDVVGVPTEDIESIREILLEG